MNLPALPGDSSTFLEELILVRRISIHTFEDRLINRRGESVYELSSPQYARCRSLRVIFAG
jgi:hypothetical protein